VDTASQPGELTLTLPSAEPALAASPELSFRPEAEHLPAEAEKPATPHATDSASPVLTPGLIQELWIACEGASCGLTQTELASALTAIGAKYNCNQPPPAQPTAAQQIAFYRSLRLPELALAQACALGHEPAWQRFLTLYRAPLTQAAVAITGSATLGHDLADSLYAELFGLSTKEGERRSPLSSYSGRGSLLGWLRTTLAQRHIDHYRRTRREAPLEDLDNSSAAPIAPTPAATPLLAEIDRLTHAVARTLASLAPEDRFLLAAYFLDQQTLLQIARLLHVHEATVSRKLKRLTADLRKQLLRNLEGSGPPAGLSKRAAEEALGADPRDLEINLRTLLQTSQPPPFSNKKADGGQAISTDNQQPATDN